MKELLLGAALLLGAGEAVRLRSGNSVAAHLSSHLAADTCPPIDDINDLRNFPTWLAYVIAIAGMLIGLFENMAGYKYWAVTVFVVCGYICGSVVYALVMTFVTSDNLYWYAYGGAAAAGLIGGFVCSAFRRLGVFLIGAGLGVVAAYFLQPVVLQFIWASHPNALLYIMMAVLGIACGLLVLCMERPLVIVSTAFIGAFIFIYSLAELAKGLPSIGSSYYSQIASHGASCVPWQVWAYAGGLLALAILGAIVQFVKTAKDVDHRRDHREQKNIQRRQEQQPINQGYGVRYV